MEDVWISLGRQPVTRDLVKPESKYGYQMYSDRFGGWRKALEAFVKYINEDDIIKCDKHQPEETNSSTKKASKKRRTSRNISDRLRFSILMRDGFTCQSCGANPTHTLGVKLHVEHIIPWSKLCKTEETNLQTKCKQCSLGKGNAFNK
ncbi:MAG: HNH endonuclease [Proteobacteria bacterium]|nr:HNH endonuclease [Pseudomonadota bacterium]